MRGSAKESPFIRFLTWLGDHEFAVLAGVASVLAGILGFILLAETVRHGSMQDFDRTLLLAMRRPPGNLPIGPPEFQEAMRDLTSLGGIAVLGLITLATAGFLILDGKLRLSLLLLGSAAGGLVMSLLLKDAFHRARPDIVPHAMYVSGLSFPSGHSTMSAAIYLTLGALLARAHERRSVKAYFLSLAGLLTVIVGVTRVYLGVHWPTDVLAGWTAGSVWALLSWLLARRLQQTRTVERPTEHTQPATE